MKAKAILAVILMLGLVLGGLAAEGHAFDFGKKKSEGLEDKFCKKAGFLLSNEEELGLSDDQVKKIKDLKLKTKKDLIKMDADVKIAELDVKDSLYQDTIDVASVKALIDKKYDLKKDKAKMLVSSYAALKDILTKEQKDKMKELWKSKKKDFWCAKMGRMGEMMKCPKRPMAE